MDDKFWKFSDYTETDSIPEDDLPAYFSALYTTWQPLDCRENNVNDYVREDGKYAEEIDIIAERPDGNPRVIARIRNEAPQKKDQPLSEKDAANATLIARAPVLFHLLRMYYRLSQENEKVEKDGILAQITREVLEDILDGKPLLFTEQVFRYRDEYLAERQPEQSKTALVSESEPEP